MGGGKGGGKKYDKELAAASKEILDTSRPVRNELSNQLLEVLQTGGSTARIPIIQQQVEGAKQAGAQAIQGTHDSLASAGLDRTPFGQQILAQSRQQAGQQENAARFNVVNQMLGDTSNFALSPVGAGLSGLNAASQGAQSRANASSQEAAGGASAAGAVLAAVIAAAASSSRRALKEDIDYLDADEISDLHALVTKMPLTAFRYIGTPTKRLGIIIEDMEDAPFVTGDTVDLYSYATALAAAVQRQEQMIRELRAEVAALKAD